MNLDQALDLARRHPFVVEAHPAQTPGMIELLLTTGARTEIAASLARPQGSDTGPQDAVERVHRAIDNCLLLSSVEPEAPQLEDAIPLVRSIDYFDPPAERTSNLLLTTLTDFIGLGLAIDHPAALQVVREEALPVRVRTVERVMELWRLAVANLRELPSPVEGGVGLSELGLGPSVLWLVAAEGNESAWLADTEAMQQVLATLRANSGTDWVVIPALRNDVFFVDTASDQWDNLLDYLEDFLDDRNLISPLPHTLAKGVWSEALPDPSTPIGMRLANWRTDLRGQMYTAQRDQLLRHPRCVIASYLTLNREGSAKRSLAVLAEKITSVPLTDLLAFPDEAEPIVIDAAMAQTRLPHLFRRHKCLGPPRLLVTPPSPEELMLLRSFAE